MEIESGRINLPSANDSFDDEDNLSDDVEDEVFIKSARNGFRHTKDKTLQKPLMAPRKNSERGNIKVCCFTIYQLSSQYITQKSLFMQKLSKNGRSNGIHPMEIHTTVPKGSPVLITVLYVAIALGSIIGIKLLQIVYINLNEMDHKLHFVFRTRWSGGFPLQIPLPGDINNDSIEDIIIGYDSGFQPPNHKLA